MVFNVSPWKVFYSFITSRWSWGMLKTCNFLILMKNLEHISSSNLIRTKLCSEAELPTRGRDLCTHVKLCYFPVPYSRQSTLHASKSCFSPFCHIIVHQSHPSLFHHSFQISPHFPISSLTTSMWMQLCAAQERETQPNSRFHLKPLPHDCTGASQPCKSCLDPSPIQMCTLSPAGDGA